MPRISGVIADGGMHRFWRCRGQALMFSLPTSTTQVSLKGSYPPATYTGATQAIYGAAMVDDGSNPVAVLAWVSTWLVGLVVGAPGQCSH